MGKSKNNELMDALKKKAEEAMQAYADKGDWKDTDLSGACGAVKLYNAACEAQMKDGIWEGMKEEWGNSSGARYPRVSYSYGVNVPPDMMYPPMDTASYNNDTQSMARGRNMSHGYDRDWHSGTNRPSDRYSDYSSGHSIKDRMIWALEQQMDEAKTEYERSQIREAIEQIEHKR